ncbi:hypothetical protein [Legionella sp. PC997]|uniref:hypothetical protein n=1 Tax=Legionella sp. PC997 TaxID=2755562 RepID=UPI0015F90791|nr:hypothetical protein [Legionella sp. PC997]QMT60819.1 hypothetical protein HBNCFIEN_02207 [Legionella sp. PC997]
MSKWKIFQMLNAEPKMSAGKAIAARIRENLSNHLTTQKKQGEDKENHPQDLLSNATSTIGKLSRIFEQMDWPIPEYEEISAEIKKVGLRAYTQSLLKDILPVLLDDTGTKLNDDVIRAINLAGKNFNPPVANLYDEYRKRNFEEEIANQFAQGIIVAFTQKVLDAEKAKSIKLMDTEINKLTEKFGNDVQKVSSSKKPEVLNKLDQLREDYHMALEEQRNANRARQTRFHEQFNTPMDELAKRTSTQGIQPTLDIDDMVQGAEFIQAFDRLVAQAADKEITIPGLTKAQIDIEAARFMLGNDELDVKSKVTLISKKLESAANKIIDAMDSKLQVDIPSPVEISVWQKILNLFTTTKEMKIYNKQQELLNKLAQGYEMQHEKIALLKVELKGNSIQVNGLQSNKARARFLDQLNADSEVKYSLDPDGNLKKLVAEKNENLSEEDIPELKEKLNAMNSAQGSLYRIIQIEIEEPSNTKNMNM